MYKNDKFLYDACEKPDADRAGRRTDRGLRVDYYTRSRLLYHADVCGIYRCRPPRRQTRHAVRCSLHNARRARPAGVFRFSGRRRRSCGKYGRLHCRIRFCGAYQRPFDQPVRPYDPRALFLHDRGTDCLLRVRQRMVLYPLYQKHRQHRHTLDPFSMRISVYPVRSCKNRISNIPCPAPEAYRRRMALMTTKETVLFMLEKSRGVPLSGAKMAKRAGVSRTAIWKAIEELRRDGYDISAAKREGYTLAANSDVLSEPRLRSYVQTQGLTFTLYKSIESTNACAKQLALSGAPEGAVVLSEMQTAGRGRGGKSFYSPAGTGLYMSILLRPEISAADALQITTCAAVAVAQAAEAAGKTPRPNQMGQRCIYERQKDLRHSDRRGF